MKVPRLIQSKFLNIIHTHACRDGSLIANCYGVLGNGDDRKWVARLVVCCGEYCHSVPSPWAAENDHSALNPVELLECKLKAIIDSSLHLQSTNLP
jgi:hypothetical protein